MMGKCQIGLAMYTVHQSAANDILGTFNRLAAMGYEAIEFYGALNQFDYDSTKEALNASGLSLAGWHVEWRDLQDDRFHDTVKALRAFSCGTAIVPCLGGKWRVAHGPDLENFDTWKRHIDWLNRTAAALGSEGLQAGYHNHEHEFQLVYEGRRVFDHLFENLDERIIMEFDSGNCIEGGGDPVQILEKYKDRTIYLHLKPYSYEKGFEVVLGGPGDANDWTRILAVPGVSFEMLLVESEATALPEMENARLCLDGLRRVLNS
ncbi:MAG: sugar phosphate isomerase/epimerase [Oscillospiraceae bacterium]|jgi:sugar phosphate isomerase/epimerase|nr:sugar phosphate isomerase/epimerase [Oscillospiraceae bacterium]